ncbi:autotransporter domain-containing protein [Novosphingobium sp.]|uniref:autotransporter domain-containing protein n=1 Tax=Novosphingobium sp. TaxID=1874826 RepID=UPI0028B0EA2F|nr:autotransporter domain-containing protein [Novosphingobium sp.]
MPLPVLPLKSIHVPVVHKLRPALLASAAGILLTVPFSAAFAADGDGGNGSNSFARGGLSSATDTGNSGQSGGVGTMDGGAGGGAGVVGGSGGTGGNMGNFPVPAGSGALSAGANGQNGSSSGGGGGGGGGGAHRYVGALSGLTGTTFQGGNGGNGGVGAGYGGGGGGGGFGAVITGLTDTTATIGSGLSFVGGNGGTAGWAAYGGNGGSGLVLLGATGTNDLTLAASVTGGTGGVSARSYSGNGASGLVVQDPAGTINLTLNGTVRGGNAGALTSGYASPGGFGGSGVNVVGGTGTTTLFVNGVVEGGSGTGTRAGGAGITGSNLNVIMSVSGSVSGGLSSSGVRAAAIAFGAGANVLEIRTPAAVLGDVTGANADDILRLGGASYVALDMASLNTGGRLGGFGTIEKTGAGTWLVLGESNFRAAWAISQGTLSLTSGNALANAASVTVDGNLDFSAADTSATIANLSGGTGGAILLGTHNLFVNQIASGTYAGALAGTGNFTKTGSGTLTLTGSSLSIGGSVEIAAGTLALTSGLSGASAFVVNGVLDVSGATSDMTIANLSGSGTVALGGTNLEVRQAIDAPFAGSLTGSGAFLKSGTGTLTLTGGNGGFTGSARVADGTLALVGSGSIAAARNVILDGTLDISATAHGATVSNLTGAASGAITLGGQTLAIDQGSDGRFDGAVNGTGTLVKAGQGVLTLANANAGFDGAVHVLAGTLALVDGGSLAGAASIALDGTLDIAGSAGSVALSNLSGSAGAGLVLGDRTLTLTQSRASDFAGQIAGTGALVKAGSDTLILSGNSSAFAGATTLQAGSLQVDGNLGGSVTTLAGTTLLGSGTIGGQVTVADGATLSGRQGGGLTMGSLVLGEGTTIVASLGAPSTATSVWTTSGAMTLDGTLHVLDEPGYGAGVYRIFSSGGTLTDNGLTLGTLPQTRFSTSLEVGGSTVDLLVVAPDTSLQFWTGNGTDQGGSGTWTAGKAWNNNTAGTSDPWAGQTGIFGGQAGTVVLEGSQSFHTLEFLTDGYNVTAGTNGALDLGTGGRLWVEGADVTTTVAAPIVGSGSLAKIGAGTLILTGDNGYEGGTLISAGTLSIDRDANLGAASGGLTFDGGTLATTGSFTTARDVTLVTDGTIRAAADTTLTLGGTISGSGGLIASGPGTVVLTGQNSYLGGTTIANGTLSVGSDANLGASEGGLTFKGGALATTASFTSGRAVELAGNADIQVAGGTTLTLNGTVAGQGGLTSSGPGTLVLGGVNTYVGGTTIKGGTVSVGADVNLGAASGSVTLAGGGLSASASFTSARDIAITGSTGDIGVAGGQTLTLTGTISGTGTLVKQDEGTLILTGDNSYTGGTTIRAGILQIGNGGATGSILGDVVNEGTLIFDRSGSYRFPGNISGSGEVMIRGGGTVDFGGGYEGAITLTESRLRLADGSSTVSQFTVGTGGVLGGNGVIGGLVVRDGGTAAPGNSPGTINVNGNVLFEAGSTYLVDVTAAGGHDLITATGTATLQGGTVTMVAEPGVYGPNTSHVILTAQGGVTGTFANVTSNLAFLSPSLSYGANEVRLDFVRNDIVFPDVAATANQRGVARSAEALGFGNALYDAIVKLTDTTAPAAFDALSGEVYATAGSVMLGDTVNLRRAVGARLGQVSETAIEDDGIAAAATRGTGTIWTQGYGSWNRMSGDGNAARVTNSGGGFFLGVDAAAGEDWQLGLVAGYGRSNLDVAARASRGTIDSYQVGFYAGGRVGRLVLKAGASVAGNDVSIDRTVAFAGFSSEEGDDYQATTAQVFGEASYPIALKGASVEPFAGLSYAYLGAHRINEKGSAASLAGRVSNADALFSSLGVRAQTRIAMGKASALMPYVSLAWQHGFGNLRADGSLGFVNGDGPTFAVAGTPLSRNAALIGAGLDFAAGDRVRISLGYQGEQFSDRRDNAVRGRVSVTF